MVLTVSYSLLVQLIPAMCLDYVPGVSSLFCLFFLSVLLDFFVYFFFLFFYCGNKSHLDNQHFYFQKTSKAEGTARERI